MALLGICAGRGRLIGHFCVVRCTSAAVLVFAVPPYYAAPVDGAAGTFSSFPEPVSAVVALCAAEDVPDGVETGRGARLLSALSFFA